MYTLFRYRYKAQEVELKKEEYFSEAGKIPRRVAFVNEGILRVCYYNSNGDEITKYFIDENNFAVDINSFTQKIPSSEYGVSLEFSRKFTLRNL